MKLADQNFVHWAIFPILSNIVLFFFPAFIYLLWVSLCLGTGPLNMASTGKSILSLSYVATRDWGLVP